MSGIDVTDSRSGLDKVPGLEDELGVDSDWSFTDASGGSTAQEDSKIADDKRDNPATRANRCFNNMAGSIPQKQTDFRLVSDM